MDFTDALWELVLGSSGRISDAFKGSAILVFAVGCAMMGSIAVLLDWILFTVRGRSFFGLTYGRSFAVCLRLVCLWGLGSGVGGFLASAASVVQFTRAACIGIGVGWPLILPKLIDSFTRDEAYQMPAETADTR
jgi:hypothetical protein